MTMAWLSASEGLRLFLEFLIKSTSVLAAGIFLAWVLRRRSASLRHFVLTFFLAGLLLLPALSSLHWGWETGLLPAGPPGPVQDRQADGDGTSAMAGYDAGILNAGGIPPGPLGKQKTDALAGQFITSLSTPAGGNENGAATEDSPKLPAPPGAIVRAARVALPPLWAAGILYFLLRIAMGLRGANRLTREGEPVRDPAWRILLARLLDLLGLRRTVHLRSHDDVVVPLTWGIVRPVILVPSGYEAWTEGQRSSALLHELSHIKRADFLVMMVVRMSLALFWFNPLAWVVFGMMRKEQEKACDELVLRTGLKPSAYAANLLLFRKASGLRWDPSTALLGMFGRSSLNERLAAILKQKLTLKEVGMKTKIMFGIVAVLAVAVIGVAKPEMTANGAADAAILNGTVAAGLFQDPASVSEGVILSEEAVEMIGEDGNAEIGLQESPTLEPRVTGQTQAQEKEKQEKEKQEQEKAKEKADERTILITTKEGKEIPIEITIVGVGGKDQKTIKVDKSIVLKRGSEGELVILGPDGKEIEVVKGDPIRLHLKEGNIQILKEGEPLKIEGKALKLARELEGGRIAVTVKEGEEGKAVTYSFVPEGSEKGGEIIISKGAIGFIGEGADKGEVNLKFVPGKDGKEMVWVGKGDVKPHAFVVSEVDVKPHITLVEEGDARIHVDVDAVTDVKPRIAWTVREDEQELKKKLEELRKTLEKVKAKELELADLEKALDEMEAELKEHEEEFKAVKLRFSDKPITYSAVRKKVDEKGNVALWIGEGDAPRSVTITTGKKGSFSMAIAAGASGMTRENYERIVDRIKKELPEGYEVEADYDSDFKEKSGVLTLKISGPEGTTGVSSELAKKLAEILKEEIKKESADKS